MDCRNIVITVTAETTVLGDAQIATSVDSRVGSVAMLLRRTFAVVLLGPLAGRRSAFMPGALHILDTKHESTTFWESRVVALKSFVVQLFARRASNVRSNSLALETAILNSRAQHKETWIGQTQPKYLSIAFHSASALDMAALRADNLDT